MTKIPTKSNQKALKKSLINFIDRSTVVIAVIGPLMTLPQVFTIFLTQNASGVSSITWFSYVFTSFIWLSYGLIHRTKAIQINSSIGLLLSSLVLLGTYIYR